MELKHPPMVMAMVIAGRWNHRKRKYVCQEAVFRLYRPVAKKNGEWILKKVRDVRRFTFKPTFILDSEGKWHHHGMNAFKKEMYQWAEETCDKRKWTFCPDATHNIPVTSMDDSYQVLLELEELAQRGE